jgi:hypothetical protein
MLDIRLFLGRWKTNKGQKLNIDCGGSDGSVQLISVAAGRDRSGCIRCSTCCRIISSSCALIRCSVRSLLQQTGIRVKESLPAVCDELELLSKINVVELPRKVPNFCQRHRGFLGASRPLGYQPVRRLVMIAVVLEMNLQHKYGVCTLRRAANKLWLQSATCNRV